MDLMNGSVYQHMLTRAFVEATPNERKLIYRCTNGVDRLAWVQWCNGALAVARVMYAARELGWEVQLPTPEEDDRDKIDLILLAPTVLLQIKSTILRDDVRVCPAMQRHGKRIIEWPFPMSSDEKQAAKMLWAGMRRYQGRTGQSARAYLLLLGTKGSVHADLEHAGCKEVLIKLRDCAL